MTTTPGGPMGGSTEPLSAEEQTHAAFVAKNALISALEHKVAALESLTDELRAALLAARRENEKGGIYIASRTRHAARWKALRDDGCPIISSWIDEAGPGQTVDWQALWERCISEASSAAALIVYADDADAYLRGALVEVGAALGHGVPVYLVLGNPNAVGSAWNHPLVTDCESFDDALALALSRAALAATPGDTATQETR